MFVQRRWYTWVDVASGTSRVIPAVVVPMLLKDKGPAAKRRPVDLYLFVAIYFSTIFVVFVVFAPDEP